MSREINQVVCIDHFFLDDFGVFHMMDSATRYSAGAVVPDTAMDSAITSLESLWISPFWAFDAVLYDPAFKNDKFQSYLSKHSIEARLLPPTRHNKNVIESKRRVIRDIYIRLKAGKDPMDDVMRA